MGTAVGALLVGAPVGEILTPRGYEESLRMPQEPQTVIGVLSPLQAEPSWGAVSVPQLLLSLSDRANLK